MQRLGMLLFMLGIGAFILPFSNLEFRVMQLFGDSQPLVAGEMAVPGPVLLVVSFARARSTNVSQ